MYTNLLVEREEAHGFKSHHHLLLSAQTKIHWQWIPVWNRQKDREHAESPTIALRNFIWGLPPTTSPLVWSLSQNPSMDSQIFWWAGRVWASFRQNCMNEILKPCDFLVGPPSGWSYACRLQLSAYIRIWQLQLFFVGNQHWFGKIFRGIFRKWCLNEISIISGRFILNGLDIAIRRTLPFICRVYCGAELENSRDKLRNHLSHL